MPALLEGFRSWVDEHVLGGADPLFRTGTGLACGRPQLRVSGSASLGRSKLPSLTCLRGPTSLCESRPVNHDSR